MQTDARWKSIPYAVKGEKATIGSAGCGITCMAMVIASLVNKNITPIDTAKWSLEHGYKAYKQGTYYSYFFPQGKAYGINVTQLNTSNIYKSNSASAEKIRLSAINELKNGNWIIACMGKGNWTSSGHYVLCYAVDENMIYINDPASTKSSRVKGNLQMCGGTTCVRLRNIGLTVVMKTTATTYIASAENGGIYVVPHKRAFSNTVHRINRDKPFP